MQCGSRSKLPSVLQVADKRVWGCCQLDAVSINMEGGVASLRIEGYPAPMPLYVGVAEAAAILYASGMVQFRRPSTVDVWKTSLKVGTSSSCSSMLGLQRAANTPVM